MQISYLWCHFLTQNLVSLLYRLNNICVIPPLSLPLLFPSLTPPQPSGERCRLLTSEAVYGAYSSHCNFYFLSLLYSFLVVPFRRFWLFLVSSLRKQARFCHSHFKAPDLQLYFGLPFELLTNILLVYYFYSSLGISLNLF